MTDYHHPEYLIDPADLESSLADENTRVFDATVFLVPADTGYRAESGRAKYAEGHVPGSAFMDLIETFADTSTGLGFSLPSAQKLQDGFRSIGVDHDSRIVFYSTGHMMWATRAWWLAYYAGLSNIAVLNGGFKRWKGEARGVETGESNYPEGTVTVLAQADYFVDKNDVQSAIEDPHTNTVNALSPEVYAGTGDMHYGRRGHIPGSLNLFYDELMQEGSFCPADDLRTTLDRQGILDADRVIAYCGGGISATIDAFACLLVGKEEVAVYDGSMSEWVREGLPLTEGNHP